jgi:hypothetical protein
MYALIENGAVAQYPYTLADLRKDNPNTSFAAGASNESLEGFGMYVVYNTTPPEYTSLQYLEEGTPVFNDNQWQQVWIVVDKTPEQIAQEEEAAKQANKQQAASLLTATDWTTIPDVSDPAISDPYLTNAAEFAAYRSNVRKIAVNPPVTVDVWPIEPDEVWAYTAP